MLLRQYPSRDKRAFSLVELSIVLVILGLLTGGILAGQSLIRASELRAVTNEYMRYSTAAQTFRDKYFAVPGDFNNATAFWGTSSSTGTVNGNGDGILAQATAINTSGEVFQFWRQLALAGLIEGSYTGIAGPGTYNPGNDTVVGANAPKSRIQNGGWGVRNLSAFLGSTGAYAYDYGNLFILGAQAAGDWPGGVLLKPEEAWNIDTKIDDGKATSGKVIAGDWASCTNSASNTDYTGNYVLTYSAPACSLIFAKQF